MKKDYFKSKAKQYSNLSKMQLHKKCSESGHLTHCPTQTEECRSVFPDKEILINLNSTELLELNGASCKMQSKSTRAGICPENSKSA